MREGRSVSSSTGLPGRLTTKARSKEQGHEVNNNNIVFFITVLILVRVLLRALAVVFVPSW